MFIQPSSAEVERIIGFDIAVDTTGNAYITGITLAGAINYPTTFGAFDETPNGDYDAFVTKLDQAGTRLVYSTLYWRKRSVMLVHAIAMDSSGNALITGYTEDGTTDFPTTPDAFDGTHNGNNDAFMTKLNAEADLL